MTTRWLQASSLNIEEEVGVGYWEGGMAQNTALGLGRPDSPRWSVECQQRLVGQPSPQTWHTSRTRLIPFHIRQ